MSSPRAFLAATLLLAASAVEAQTTVFRSIGIAGGTLYSTGTASVALGGTTVNFGGGACLPSNVGQGDQLVIGGETFYILSRNTSSQVTVQTAAVAAHAAEAYTISRAYNSLQAWETGQQGDLVGGNRVEVGVAYNDGPFTTGLTISGSTTNATRFMRLTVDLFSRHNGTAGTGVVLDGLDLPGNTISVEDDFSVVEWFEFRRHRGTNGLASVTVQNASGVLLQHLLIHDFDDVVNTVVGIKGGVSSAFTVRNSILYDGGGAGQAAAIRGTTAPTTVTVQNTTIFGMAGRGIYEDNGTFTVTNTIAMGSAVVDFDVVTGTQSFNLSSDATAAGAGSLINRLASNQFLRTTAGSEDLHLKAGADALNAGTTLGGFSVDADGDGRPGITTAWDMGADERGTVVFRSIGTNPGALAAGSATVPLGGVTVTFGAALPANVGTGDELNFLGPPTETLFILSRDSSTQVTLQSTATLAHTGQSYDITRAFNDFQPWEAAREGDLVAQNKIEVGVAYNDGPFVYNSGGPPSTTPALVIQGSTTSPRCYIRLTVAENQRHNGTAGTGVVLDGTGNTKFGVRVRDDYTVVEWLSLKGFHGPGLAGADGVSSAARNVLLHGLIIHGFFDGSDSANGIRTEFGTSASGLLFTARNCIVYDGDQNGIRVDNCDASAIVLNSTVYNMHGTGGRRGVAATSAGASMTVTNTISMGNATDFSAVAGATLTQSFNLSSDATASGASSLINKLVANQFVDTTVGLEDLHLKAGADALDTGLDLSSSFWDDIDRQSRLGLTWDIGADESGAPTEVKLLSFQADGFDAEVVLQWRTASELRNLGFHLYRATDPAGPYERITENPIPGLGSSPSGASYRHADSGLANDVPYFYRLEDIDERGALTLHGPVSATPRAGAGQSPPEIDAPSVITFGDPAANRVEFLESGRSGVTVRITTEGFYATPNDDGTVNLDVPGFEVSGEEGAPALPLLRPWIDAVAGRGVRLVSVDEDSLARFASLTPSGAARPGIEASFSGVVRPQRRFRRLAERSGLFPPEPARIVGTGFQSETKKVQLELAPMRWDPQARELTLARRLVVRLAFDGGARDETSENRRFRRRASREPRSVLTRLARLATTEPGLHVVRYEELFGRGARAFSADSLRLSRLGEPVPFHLEPQTGRLAPGSRLYFTSPGGAANPYGHEAVFDLDVSSHGSRMEVRSAAPSLEQVPFGWARVEREINRFYQAGLVDAHDLWFWDMLLSPASKSFPFETYGLTGDAAQVEVRLQGASDFEDVSDHHVAVYLNGSWIGEATWDGKTSKTFDADLAPGLLKEGANDLVIRNLGDAGASYSMVFLDRFTIQYPQKLDSRRGPFEGGFSRTGAVSISGVGVKARVLDITRESRPVWLARPASTPDGSISFSVEQGHRYLAASEDDLRRPRILKPPSFRLKSGKNQSADYLVVAPGRYLGTLEPLLALRRGQGLRVRAVALEQVFDEFGFGEERPEAIRDFLKYAYREDPRAALRYVLLVGDATYDFKDYLETGVENVLPPLMVRTSYLWTASDPSLAMVHGDDLLPDVALGRLPAADEGELRVMVDKILAYEAGAASLYSSPLVLVADNADGAGDFEANAEEIASTTLAGKNVRNIYVSSLGARGAKDAVRSTFDDGASLVSYIGHGGIALWADEHILNVEDVETLHPQAQQPLLLTMNCLNGYFHFPYFDSLSEALLKAEDRGVVAAFSPSGLSLNAPAHRYHQAILAALFRREHRRLGDAVLEAQEAYAASGAFPELLLIYHLLGDPALTLH